MIDSGARIMHSILAEGEFQKEIARFESYRDIGMIATNLHREADELMERARQTAMPGMEVPEGFSIVVRPGGKDSNQEDPMNIEVLDADNEWSRARPDGSVYDDAIVNARDVKRRFARPVFLGASLELDADTDELWVYNRTGDARVEYRKGIQLSVTSS